MRKRKIACWKKIAVCGLIAALCLTCVETPVQASSLTGNKTGTKTESGTKTDTKKESVESATAATVQLSKTEGTVTVSNAAGKEVKQIKKMRLLDGYHVETEKKSYAWEELDKTKLIKEDAVSEVEIRKSGKLLEILLNSGNMFFNVTEKLADDETMNICTSSMIAGIRGTCGWVKVIDKMCTRIYLLEGELECVVADPVTGQSKVTRLKGGQRADFYVYDKTQRGDKCDIVMEGFAREDVPGFVLVELAGDMKRCQEIFEDSGIDLRDLTMEEALKRLKEDEDAIEEELEKIEEEVAKQENNISQDPVWEDKAPGSSPAVNPPQVAANTTPPAPGGGNDGGGSSTPNDNTSDNSKKPEPNPPRQTPQNVDVTEDPGAVEDLLDDGKDVVVKGDDTSNVYQIDSDLHIPEGSTLTIKDGLTLVVASAATVTVDGTLKAQGDMENNGRVIINSNKSMHVKGDLVNTGSIINQNKGLVDAAKGIDNYGTITCGGTSTMYSSSKAGTVRMCGESSKLTVEGGDITNKSSGAALALEEATQIGNITFTTSTLLQSVTENVLTVGGKKLKVSNYDTSFDSGSNFFQFKIEVKTVTFDGGEGSSVKPVKVIVGFPVGTGMPTLTKAGYELSGWNTAADGSGKAFTKDTAVQDDITVYAQWKENKKTHTVTFDANGGTLSGDRSVTVAHNGTVDLPTPAAPEGYSFFGWYTAKDSKGKKVTGSEAITANITYYARYVAGTAADTPTPTPAKTWNVTFNANGGSLAAGTTSPVSVNDGEKVTKPADPARAGYTFGGWHTDAACTKAYDFGTAVTADVTLYAKWTLNAYTVTFNANGGTIGDSTGAAASETTAVTVNYGEKVAKPTTDPVRADYVFVEWCTDKEGTKTYDFNTAVSADITLYAKWTRNQYVVTFDSQGGSTVAAQTVNGNETAEEPTAPTRTGYTFDGWYTEAACETKYNFSTPVSANITLYAKWTLKNYTVTFNAKGGSFAAATGAAASESTTQTVGHGGKATAPTEPERTGYTFDKWYTSERFTEAYDFDTAVTADITLYAKWTVNTYTVTLNVNEGMIASGKGVTGYTYGVGVTLPVAADVTRTGYTFGGWYAASDFSGTAVTAISATDLGDKTFYAKWTVATYTVTFETNGGSAVAAQTVEYNKTVTKPASDPERTNYVFGGWYADEKYMTKFDFTSKVTEDITIYAKWEINAGDFYVAGGEVGTDFEYDDQNYVLKIKSSKTLTIRNTDPSYPTYRDTIVVEDGINADIVLAGVDISTSSDNALSMKSAAGGSAKITLASGTENRLYSEENVGLLDAGSGTLIIAGEGQLKVTGDEDGYGGYNHGIEAASFQMDGGIVSAMGYSLGIDAASIQISKGILSVKDNSRASYSITKAPASGSGVIVFENGSGKVYSDTTLTQDMEITYDQLLIIPAGTKLTVPAGVTLTNYGSIVVETGASLEGTVVDNGTILKNGVYNYGAVGNESKITAVYKDIITTAEIKDGTYSIGSGAFEGCVNLTAISLPDSVRNIYESAFEGCTGLTTMTIPSGVTSIGSSAFEGCTGLTTMTIPSGVTSIGSSAFEGCTGLTTMTIPSGVTEIKSATFKGCTGLTSVTMPGVTKIRESAFEGCTKLADVPSLASVTVIGNNAFKDCDKLKSVYVPLSSANVGTGCFPATVDLYAGVSKPDWASNYPDNKYFLKEASGSSIYWNLTDGVLTLGGTGSTKKRDYSNDSNTAWRKDADRGSITSVVIQEGLPVSANMHFINAAMCSP